MKVTIEMESAELALGELAILRDEHARKQAINPFPGYHTERVVDLDIAIADLRAAIERARKGEE